MRREPAGIIFESGLPAVCEIPISQLLKLSLRGVRQLVQGHRRTEPEFTSRSISLRSLCFQHQAVPPSHSPPSLRLHLKALTLPFAASGGVWITAPVPSFVLQPLELPPASGDQKGTEPVPAPLNGATFV